MDLEIVKKEAILLMEEHGLLDKGWYFEFDKANRRFGICNYRKKKIGLSKHLTEINSFERIKNTILHEIAHALVGPEHGHDHIWRAKAIEIGCDGERCYSSETTNIVKGKYLAVCNICKHEHYKHRLSRRKHSCGKCSNRFNPNNILVYKLVNQIEATSN